MDFARSSVNFPSSPWTVLVTERDVRYEVLLVVWHSSTYVGLDPLVGHHARTLCAWRWQGRTLLRCLGLSRSYAR